MTLKIVDRERKEHLVKGYPFENDSFDTKKEAISEAIKRLNEAGLETAIQAITWHLSAREV